MDKLYVNALGRLSDLELLWECKQANDRRLAEHKIAALESVYTVDEQLLSELKNRGLWGIDDTFMNFDTLWNEKMPAAIDAAVEKLHYVQTDEGGQKYFEIYADYNDTNKFLLETAYEHRNDNLESPDEPYLLEDSLREQIAEVFYEDTKYEMEDGILSEAGIDVLDDCANEARDYLREQYYIQEPFDHYLDQTMKVNIMLALPNEKNTEYTLIMEQYKAMVNPDALTNPDESLGERTSLTWLLEQQGHTLQELQNTMKEYKEFLYDPDGSVHPYFDAEGKNVPVGDLLEHFNCSHFPFLTSLCQELENQNYDMCCLTVLAEMTMKEFCEMQKNGSVVTMPKESMVGLYNPWNGAGSVFEIELEKDLEFPQSMIRDVQIEGVETDCGEYTVDDVYGLVGSCWKRPKLVSPEPERKPGIDALIAAADSVKAGAGVADFRKEPEQER